MKQVTFSEVNKKHLRIVSYLAISWVISLALVYVTKNEYLVGLAPLLNYLAFAIEKELKGEGYIKAK